MKYLHLLTVLLFSFVFIFSFNGFCGKRKGGSIGSKKGFFKKKIEKKVHTVPSTAPAKTPVKTAPTTTTTHTSTSVGITGSPVHKSTTTGSVNYAHTGSVPSTSSGSGVSHGFHGSLIEIIVIVVIGIIVLGIFIKSFFGGPKFPEQSMASGFSSKPKGSILKFQLGLYGIASEVQKKLIELSQSGKIETQEDQAWLLKEISLTLMRNLDSVRYVGFEKIMNLSLDEAEIKFTELADEERAKYQIEGVRVDDHGVMTDSTEAKAGLNEVSEYIVVTIIIATDLNELIEDLNMPPQTPIKTILNRIASIPGDNLLGMEIIWQPYSPEEGVLTEKDMISLYPEMRVV